MIFSLIVGLILSIVALVFALQNTQSVHMAFLFWHLNGSLALLLIIFFVVGILAGILMMLPGRIQSGLAITRKSKEFGELEAKLAEYKGKVEGFESKINEKANPKNPSPANPARKS